VNLFRNGLIDIKNACLLGVALAVIMASSTRAQDHSFELLATPIPPLTMEDTNRPGFLTTLLREMGKRISAERPDFKIKFIERLLPWSRSLATLEDRPQKLLTPIARTDERENKFVWITTVMRLHFAFASIAKPVDSFEQAKTLPQVAVYRNSQHESLLLGKGFTNLIPNSGETNARMLAFGRVTAWYSSVPEAQWQWKIQNLSPPLVLGESMYSLPIWLAGSRDFPKDLVPLFRRIMRAMKSDGTYDQIYHDYFNHPAPPFVIPEG
jgi:polar amino acid transport system substrate-binding protein